MAIGVKYENDSDDIVRVYVTEHRKSPKTGIVQRRSTLKEFGKGPKAADDGLIFVHGVNHGEIKPDDILPPWGD